MANPIILARTPRAIPPQEPIAILECRLNCHRSCFLKKALQTILALNDHDVPLIIKSSKDGGLDIQANPERSRSHAYVVATLNIPKYCFIQHTFASDCPHFTVPINMLLEGFITVDDKEDIWIVTYFQELLEYIHGYMHIKSLGFLMERPAVVYTQMLMDECQYFNYVLDTIYIGLIGIPSVQLVEIMRHFDNGEGDDELNITIRDTHVILSLGNEGIILVKDDNECIIGGRFGNDTEVDIPLGDVRESWELALQFTKVVWVFISEDCYALYCFPIAPLGNLFYCFEDDDDDEEEEEEEEDDKNHEEEDEELVQD